jgi:hypothetical protein
MTIAGIQLYLGTLEQKLYSPQKIATLLTSLFNNQTTTRLLLWNCLGQEYLDAVASACLVAGVELYLWYPVFADRLSPESEQEIKIQSAWGHIGYGERGLWKGIDQGEETFVFSCPNAVQSQEIFHSDYLRLIDSGIFNGVFLDRIRYPSPSNGLEMLFSCFCPVCMQTYAKAGIDPIELKNRTKKIFTNIPILESVLENCTSWNGFLKISGIDILHTVKVQSVHKTFSWLAAEAKKRKMDIGADLFTPGLAPLVGQDYDLFHAQCNWIKPMTYFFARGPAGIQLEMQSLKNGMREMTYWDEPKINNFIQRITNLPMESSSDSTADSIVSLQYLRNEVSAAIKVGRSDNCSVYPGIEMVRHPRFSPAITKKMLNDALSYLPHETQGIIPSWNLLYIPDEYYRMVLKSSPGGKL